MDSLHYKTIQQTSTAEFRDRGSKFIAYAFPVTTLDEIKSHIKKLKSEHPKAVHCCYAYRLGFNGTEFRANDDGEPSGSAGKPILGQLDSAGITNTLVAVIRYFGGVLLGVPGLINAYKTVAQEAIALNTMITKPIEKTLTIEFDYTLMNEVMRVTKQYPCTVIYQELLLFATMTISIPLANFDAVHLALSGLFGVKVIPLNL
jgi:uncharacterized YigZ family protein